MKRSFKDQSFPLLTAQNAFIDFLVLLEACSVNHLQKEILYTLNFKQK